MDVYSLDIGGSSIKHAVVTVEGTRAKVKTRIPEMALSNHSFAELREKVISAVAIYAQEAGRRVAVAISTAGAVDRSGLVLSCGHFDGYIDVSWPQILQSELPELAFSVLTVNDGKASTWAEYKHLGLGDEVFAHFVVGTGVGGGLVCFDKLLYGDDETAGALGHMKVGGAGDVVCSCGRHGCVETLASAPAIARAFGKCLDKDGGHHGTVPTFEDAFRAARNRDPRALRAFEEAGEWLGVAISNVINVLNPRHITLGGGVLLASSDLEPVTGGPYVRSAIRRASEMAFEDIAEGTIISPASAGNDGGLLGAALLCASHIEAAIQS